LNPSACGPGNPQQNGRNERMHLTLKQEATRPAAENILQQQAKFDAFLAEFNQERPHEALLINRQAYGFRNFQNQTSSEGVMFLESGIVGLPPLLA
jgi:transposase InsO family protein